MEYKHRNKFINSFSLNSETENIIKRVALEKGITKSKAVVYIVSEYDKHVKEGVKSDDRNN